MIACIRHQLTIASLLCALVSGCTLCRNAHRTLILEPRAYSWKSDRQRSLKTYARWAEQAWAVEQHHGMAAGASVEYGRGFRDGFVDYVYAGGNGEPPPVPPRRFWNVELRNAAGRSAANDWFAGYRHGAGVARAGGFRREATLKSSLWIVEEHELGLYPRGYPDLAPWEVIEDYEALPLPEPLMLDEDEPADWPLVSQPILSAGPALLPASGTVDDDPAPGPVPPLAAPTLKESDSVAELDVPIHPATLASEADSHKQKQLPESEPRTGLRAVGSTSASGAADQPARWQSAQQTLADPRPKDSSTLRVLSSTPPSPPPSATTGRLSAAPSRGRPKAAAAEGTIRILRYDEVSESAPPGAPH